MTDPRTRARDAGFSLVEVMVSMTLMGTVGAVFTTAILQAYRVTDTVDTMSQAQNQVRLALQRLDSEIRYAYDITVPTTPEEATAASGTWSVEFVRADLSAGTEQCDQLRLRNGVLFLRSWTPGTPPATAGTALASDIDMSVFATTSATGAVVPFDRQAADSTPLASATAGASFSPDFQRLRLRLTTAVGGQRMPTDVTFTALNTTRTNDSAASRPTADVCQDEGR